MSSKLYEPMTEDMQLQSLSPRTQETYVRPVRQPAEFYAKARSRITEEQLCQYFLQKANKDHWSRSACAHALCGIKFFYQTLILQRDLLSSIPIHVPKSEARIPKFETMSNVQNANFKTGAASRQQGAF